MNAPKRGDLIKCDFDNTIGHEQSDYRRALVISDERYNARTDLAIVCAITNQIKGWNIEVHIPNGLSVTGVILPDQVRTIDWRCRNAVVQDHVPDPVMEEVLAKLLLIIYPQ